MGDLVLQVEILGKVALALVLGGVIGLERESADKPAGFRTQMIVAGAAALLVGLGDIFLRSLGAGPTSGLIQSDPIRIIEAVVTGVAFLGAGTIFRRGATDHVEGLTTAATLLMSAAVGICVALGQYPLAVGVTGLTLVVLWLLRIIEDLVKGKRKPHS